MLAIIRRRKRVLYLCEEFHPEGAELDVTVGDGEGEVIIIVGSESSGSL